jgi:alkanesulfonate monooxygenase SsuD/methylene tetrahydromethanopterin reductase-like flavin-dependent oxidoreductase (luciferase family)
MLGLVARYADGYNSTWHLTPESMVERFATVDAACRVAGRDPATLRHTSGSYVALPGSDGQVPPQRLASIRTSPEDLAERLYGFHRAGADHFTLSLEPFDAAGLERCGRTIETLRKLERQ